MSAHQVLHAAPEQVPHRLRPVLYRPGNAVDREAVRRARARFLLPCCLCSGAGPHAEVRDTEAGGLEAVCGACREVAA
jgi:hypothetical protein